MRLGLFSKAVRQANSLGAPSHGRGIRPLRISHFALPGPSPFESCRCTHRCVGITKVGVYP